MLHSMYPNYISIGRTLIGINDLPTNTSYYLQPHNSLIGAEIYENTRVVLTGHKTAIDIELL